MEDIKKNFIICSLLIVLAILYTILVKTVDLSAIGPNNSIVGFSTINNFFFSQTGENKIWYYITEILAIIPLFMAFSYALIGLKQLIKKKNLLKIDKELLGLAVFYIIVISVYIFFEIFVVNYRPILIDNELEASYPSSHTLIALCLCGSSILINNKLYSKYPITKIINPILTITMIILIIGRLLSGVHWFTDILGGVIIASALLYCYYTFLNYKKH